MTRRILLSILCMAMYVAAYAQTENEIVNELLAVKRDYKHSRVSLIICSEGNMSWESFGHSTIRVIDSTKNDITRDVIYNYGTFDFFDGSFVQKFIRGNMRAYLETAPFPFFIQLYRDEGRGVTEQEICLNDEQRQKVISFLENNARFENRFYNYDLAYDNCTTRIRDMFTKTLNKDLVFGNVVPAGSYLTFRKICEDYCKNKQWLRLALEIFFSSKTDIIVTNEQAMFVPTYLDIGLSNATVSGHKLCSEKKILYEDKLDKPTKLNYVFISMLIMAIVVIAFASIKKISIIGNILSSIVMIAVGIMGCCILYAWFVSTHIECKNNYNILWALPTNIIFPFLYGRTRRIYSLIAGAMIICAIIIDLLKIQVMPLFELAPLFIMLLYIYVSGYGKGNIKPVVNVS